MIKQNTTHPIRLALDWVSNAGHPTIYEWEEPTRYVYIAIWWDKLTGFDCLLQFTYYGRTYRATRLYPAETVTFEEQHRYWTWKVGDVLTWLDHYGCGIPS
jgi:hypothetical protein